MKEIIGTSVYFDYGKFKPANSPLHLPINTTAVASFEIISSVLPIVVSGGIELRGLV